jgi:hypothetical protein
LVGQTKRAFFSSWPDPRAREQANIPTCFWQLSKTPRRIPVAAFCGFAILPGPLLNQSMDDSAGAPAQKVMIR